MARRSTFLRERFKNSSVITTGVDCIGKRLRKEPQLCDINRRHAIFDGIRERKHPCFIMTLVCTREWPPLGHLSRLSRKFIQFNAFAPPGRFPSLVCHPLRRLSRNFGMATPLTDDVSLNAQSNSSRVLRFAVELDLMPRLVAEKRRRRR